MKIKNTKQTYGAVSILIHWLMALIILGLYFLGSYIVDLSYYDPLYRTLPDLHRSFGVVIFVLLTLRLCWTLSNPKTLPVQSVSRIQIKLGKLVHNLLYLLMLVVPLTGYLISTADGRAIDVFGLIEVPALSFSIDKQEEIAGDWHYWSSNLLIFLVLVHTLGALKHHFINRDQTLVRMLGKVDRVPMDSQDARDSRDVLMPSLKKTKEKQL